MKLFSIPLFSMHGVCVCRGGSPKSILGKTPQLTFIYLNLPWFASIYFDLSHFTSIYLDLPQFTSTCLDLHQLTLIYLNLPWFSLIYLNLFWFTTIYLNFISSDFHWLFWFLLTLLISTRLLRICYVSEQLRTAENIQSYLSDCIGLDGLDWLYHRPLLQLEHCRAVLREQC